MAIALPDMKNHYRQHFLTSGCAKVSNMLVNSASQKEECLRVLVQAFVTNPLNIVVLGAGDVGLRRKNKAPFRRDFE